LSYYNVVEVESAIAGLANGYPALCQLIELPNKTVEGRTCHALRIGLAQRSTYNSGVLIMGCAHASEWGGAEISIHFAIDLLESYTAGNGMTYGMKSFTAEEVQRIITRLDVFVLPQINPDGRNYSQTIQGDWRKNRNGPGVDLNRNYDFLWYDTSAYPFTSSSPSSPNYKGPAPGSEAETRNIIWLVANSPTIRWIVDLHSGSGDGETVLWAWSDDESQTIDPDMNFANKAWDGSRGEIGDEYREYIPPLDRLIVQTIGDRVRDAIQAAGGNKFFSGEGVTYYFSGNSGLATDYFYSRHFLNTGLKRDFEWAKTYGFGIEFAKESPLPWLQMEPLIPQIDAGLFQFCLDVVPAGPPAAIFGDPYWWIKLVATQYQPAGAGAIRPPISGSLSPEAVDLYLGLAICELALQVKDTQTRQSLLESSFLAMARQIDDLVRRNRP
jgi:murein tripeptide amidase MpaA